MIIRCTFCFTFCPLCTVYYHEVSHLATMEIQMMMMMMMIIIIIMTIIIIITGDNVHGAVI